MNISYKTKSKGYMPVHRSIQKLLNNPDMSFSMMGAYICFSFQADWDKKHEYYRAILPNNDKLAETWCCDVGTVIRNRQKLVKVGLLEVKNKITYVKNLDMFKILTIKAIVKSDVANIHNYYAKSELELAEMIFNSAKSQENEPEL